MPDAPRALSAKAVAQAWGVSERHVTDLCARKALGHFRVGRTVRIRPADIEAYEKNQWRGPEMTAPTTGSSSAEIISMSAGGKAGRGTAFQRGRQTAVKPADTARSS